MIVWTKIKKRLGVLSLGSLFIPLIFISAQKNSNSKTESKTPKINSWYKAPGSKITNGDGGTIFQAQNGDLYVMGYWTSLEVIENNNLKFAKTDVTIKDRNNGIIIITNFKNKYSNLQYKKTTDSIWINVPLNGKINDLSPGKYQFQWVGKNGEQYVGTVCTTKMINQQQIINVKKTSSNKTIILAITIPIGFIVIIGIILTIKNKKKLLKYFKKLKNFK